MPAVYIGVFILILIRISDEKDTFLQRNIALTALLYL